MHHLHSIVWPSYKCLADNREGKPSRIFLTCAASHFQHALLISCYFNNSQKVIQQCSIRVIHV